MHLLEDKTGLPVMAAVGWSHYLARSKCSVNAERMFVVLINASLEGGPVSGGHGKCPTALSVLTSKNWPLNETHNLPSPFSIAGEDSFLKKNFFYCDEDHIT